MFQHRFVFASPNTQILEAIVIPYGSCVMVYGIWTTNGDFSSITLFSDMSLYRIIFVFFGRMLTNHVLQMMLKNWPFSKPFWIQFINFLLFSFLRRLFIRDITGCIGRWCHIPMSSWSIRRNRWNTITFSCFYRTGSARIAGHCGDPCSFACSSV